VLLCRALHLQSFCGVLHITCLCGIRDDGFAISDHAELLAQREEVARTKPDRDSGLLAGWLDWVPGLGFGVRLSSGEQFKKNVFFGAKCLGERFPVMKWRCGRGEG
jgi:hypothetical protein